MRTHYPKKQPNDRIPPQTLLWRRHEDITLRLCDMTDDVLGDCMNWIVQSAELERMMKIGQLAQFHLKDDPYFIKEDEKKQYTLLLEVMQSTWREYLPKYFDKMELEASRRGLLWDLRNEKEVRLRTQHLESVIDRMVRLIKQDEAMPTLHEAGRVQRQVDI